MKPTTCVRMGCLPLRCAITRLAAFGTGIILLAVVGMVQRVNSDEHEEALKRWGASFEEKVLPILQSKCNTCHSGETPDGEFDLARFKDGPLAVEGGDAWERVARRVRLNEMPPPGSPGLSDPEKGAFHRWVDSRPGQDLCHQLASDETQSWYRGNVMSRRLTRYEYANAIRDLLDVDVPDELLPPSDGAGGMGFDTSGDSLFTSPIHLEAYMRATKYAVDRAIARDASGWDGSGNGDSIRLWLESTARRAWRRPVSSDEVSRLMGLFQREYDRTTDEQHSRSIALQAILLSPHFLFLVEPEPEFAGIQRLTPFQFATRMALLVWSSIPDEALLQSAERGDLMEESVMRAHLQRMLSDDRSRSLGENFGLQWLGLRDYQTIQPDRGVYPDWNPELTNDAIEETVRTIASVFREGRPLMELLDCDTVLVNERLAKHYGLEWNGSHDWQRIENRGRERGGILTMASVLMKTSYPRRTSPVLRGRWVLEDVLGAKVPPPPPNVPTLDEGPAAIAASSLRERLEKHRTNPDCASCHQRMDPLGFALENFDAIGRWRIEESGIPIDASATLPSGETFKGPVELKRALMERRDEIQTHFIKKFLGFALGRELNKFDQCVIDACLKRLSEGRGADAILEEVLQSYPFQHRYYNPATAKS